MRVSVARVFLILILAPLLSCHPSKPEPTPPVAIGKSAFDFDWQKATQIQIAKNDAASGDIWTTTLRKEPGNDPEHWEIPFSPQGSPLIDRRADGAFVGHLLDTLRTLKVAEWAKKGPLDSFGLNPPSLGLRWTAEDKTFEIQFGNFDSAGRSRFAYIPVEGLGDQQYVFLAQGAALQMLANISNFDVLRRRTLSTLTEDDVDQLDFYQGNRKISSIQRQGSTWVDAQGKPASALSIEWVAKISHLRIQRFEDNPGDAKTLLTSIEAKPDFKLVLRDREDHPTTFLFAGRDAKFWATVSSRPQAVFEIFPEILLQFRLWAQKR